MMVSFKCPNRCKAVFDHLMLSFYAVDMVLMCKIGVKCKYASPAMCATAHLFFLIYQCVCLLSSKIICGTLKVT